MKQLIIFSFLLFSIQTFSQIPSGYYNGTEGQDGYTLKTTLYNIIKGHTQHSYNNLYVGYETTDVDNYYENDGTVLDMYSENPTGADPYNWTHSNDHCGSYTNEGVCWNREHLFPQGFFDEDLPMRSDIHFVVPSDGKVNGMRNNYPFGEVASASWTSLNGSKKGSSASAGYSGTVFEPIDEFKGDIARCMLYFVTRYQNQLSSFNPSATNNPLDGSSDRGYEAWEINVFLAWHEQDPVSQREIDRNNAAYDYQGNRNPYIDHPEWVECIWATCTSLNFTSSPVTSAMATQLYSYDITYNVDSDTETLTCTTKPSWLTFTKDEANNTALLTGTPSNSDVGNHSVVLTLEEDGETKTQSFTITVDPYNNEVIILNKDFNDNSITSGGWTTQSIIGSEQEWFTSTHSGYTNGYYAKMSGYDGSNNNENEDWLISPAINTDDYDGEVLNFVTSMNEYGTDNTFNIYILEDYDGTSNPSTATLNDITSLVNLSPGDYTFTNSGDINLSSYTGTIYLAFKYTSGSNNGRTWEVEDIILKGNIIENVNTLNSKIKIYPNPANQIININSSNIIQDINIYSVIGQKVLTYNNLNTNTYQISIKDLIKGVYFIEIIDKKNNKILKKLIKE